MDKSQKYRIWSLKVRNTAVQLVMPCSDDISQHGYIAFIPASGPGGYHSLHRFLWNGVNSCPLLENSLRMLIHLPLVTLQPEAVIINRGSYLPDLPRSLQILNSILSNSLTSFSNSPLPPSSRKTSLSWITTVLARRHPQANRTNRTYSPF